MFSQVLTQPFNFVQLLELFFIINLKKSSAKHNYQIATIGTLKLASDEDILEGHKANSSINLLRFFFKYHYLYILFSN